MGILPREANYVGQNQSTRLTPAQSRRTKHKENLGATGGPLLSQQFTPMNTIKRAYAVDVAGTVGKDLIPEKQRQVTAGEGDTADYPLLVDTMKKQGVMSIPPVHFGTVDSMNSDYGPGIPHFNSLHLVGKGNAPALGNGGHRTAIASDLGWKVMHSTPDKAESGYKETQWGAGDSEYGESGSSSGYHSGSESWRGSTNASYSSDHSSSASSGNTAYSPGTPQPGDRSFVPMQNSYGDQVGGADPGARWHADGRDGSKPPGEGLYSQLHPPQAAAAAPLSHLNQQQFSNSKQDLLPGMEIDRFKPPSYPRSNQRNAFSGPVPDSYTGGNASFAGGRQHGGGPLPSLSQALAQAQAARQAQA